MNKLATETPKEAARRLSAHMLNKGFRPIALHTYTDPQGEPIYYRIRLKHPETGEKWIRPMHLNGKGFELCEPKFPNGKPLFALHHIASNPNKVIWIVEGEQKVDALNKLGLVATTSSGGAASAGAADWEPLRGRTVIIWRDNDDPGKKYAGQVASTLLGIDCTVSCVEVEKLGLGKGEDVVDWLAKHPAASKTIIEELPKLIPPPQREKRQEGDSAKRSIAQVLIGIGTRCDLFHDERFDAYAVAADKHIRRTLRLCGRDFRRWLCGRYYAETGKAANGQAIAAALAVLDAKAVYDGTQRELSNRFAIQDGRIYIDLCDDRWRAVCVSADGWKVLDKPPILFRRYSHQHHLPDPQHGGSLDELKGFLNLRDDDEWHLVEAWLATVPFTSAPRPALTLHGPQGAAKSTSARALKSLLDPSAIDAIDLGRDTAGLAQILDHHAIPCFDNLTGVPTWAADMLCKAVTGGGFTKRELYTDSEDVLLAFRRAVIVTGINIPTHAPDLLDRMLLIELDRIPPEKRRDENEFWTKFNAARPRLFGALLDAISGILRQLGRVRPSKLPRMADFARLACAYAEHSGFRTDAMLKVIMDNAGRQTEEVIESDTLAMAVRDFIEKKQSWQGTASDLLVALQSGNSNPAPEGWPKSSRSLGKRLKVLQTTLAEIGITVIWKHSSDKRQRLIELAVAMGNQTSETSEMSGSRPGGGIRADMKSDQRTPNVRQTSGCKATSGADLNVTDVSDDKLHDSTAIEVVHGVTDQNAGNHSRW